MRTSLPDTSTRTPASVNARAFTVLELLVAISIMGLIIFALYSMFNQTQRALRSNVAQVDVMEAGRATMEMMARELEQMSPCNVSNTVNFHTSSTRGVGLEQLDINDIDPLRTNYIDQVYFLTPETNKWHAVGYRVMDSGNGVGTLYRFGMSTNKELIWGTNLFLPFIRENLKMTNINGQLTNHLSRVADGIIHLRVTPFDESGLPLRYNSTNQSSRYRIIRRDFMGGYRQFPYSSQPTNGAAVFLQQQVNFVGTDATFISNALPSYVELELGILEQAALDQYNTFRPNSPEAKKFLARRAGKVHLFRQRIPIRNTSQ